MENKKDTGGIDNTKNFFQKFWHLLWKDNSPKGWIFSIVFLIIFMLYVFFPLLNWVAGFGLSFSTTEPLALRIVESCSMYHKGDFFSSFDSWWERHEPKYVQYSIGKEDFQKFPLKKGFNKGDILFIVGAKPNKLEVGDVIIFEANLKNPIIHRIIKINTDPDGKKTFSTIGDNNPSQLEIEKQISSEQISGKNIKGGKAVFKLVPMIGWLKLAVSDFWNKIFYKGEFEYISNGFCTES